MPFCNGLVLVLLNSEKDLGREYDVVFNSI